MYEKDLYKLEVSFDTWRRISDHISQNQELYEIKTFEFYGNSVICKVYCLSRSAREELEAIAKSYTDDDDIFGPWVPA